MNTLHFRITNLTCDACVKVCTMLLKKLPGVTDVSIDVRSGLTNVASSELLDIDVVQHCLGRQNYQLAEQR